MAPADEKPSDGLNGEHMDAFANGVCAYGENRATGAGCILPAGHEPTNRHVVTPGDADDA
ncbi:hypothetical protein ACWGH7_16610 [Streptomyces cyaneofuscatus]